MQTPPISGAGLVIPDTGVLANWLCYFRSNREHLLPIPWDVLDRLTDEDRQTIAKSIQKFQLGESSEGSHLMKMARAETVRRGDPTYAETLKLFIGEEQRHARDLGRFMEREAIPLARHDWSDAAFRRLRRLINLETALMVLLTAELVATVYYKALRDATPSPLLRQICIQILHDENQHVAFQSEALRILRQGRPVWQQMGLSRLHQIFFALTLVVVWADHGPVFRAAGYGFGSFWGECWAALARSIALARSSPNG
ncbi:hypothetical protein BST81_26035 [Leptolyngbya sp. 'hensonii']|nr:hypothetical protein BST81_26035 [Leptolyngbya sp. 'hensonii']